MDDDLGSRWARWLGESAEASAALAGLRARYAEPHRRYHGVAHLEQVTATVARLASGLPDPGPVQAAAFFHDAIYDPRSSTNEVESARLAEHVLTELGWSSPRRATVSRLVLATADHAVTDLESAILLDADLAVLGAAPSEYARYVAGVRAEYAHVAEDQWRIGRAAVLRNFLDRPRLFHTPEFSEREGAARVNLRAELASLEGPTGPDQ
jgi:predicted metal-dependent HD superfamily phosphohydrolase